MENYIDAHMHLNMKSADPAQDLRTQMDSSGIDRALLILNEPAEIDCFASQTNRFRALFEKRLAIARLLSPSTAAEGLRQQAAWRSEGFPVCTKIHPRISGLTMRDAPAIERMIGEDESKTAVIDSFFFGFRLDEHIGIELAIRLAQRYPEKNIVIAHAGGHRFTDCMLYTRPLDNIHYDLALTCTFFEGASIDLDIVHFLKYTHGRILYGSDYPEYAPERAIRRTAELIERAGLTAEQTHSIFRENAMRLYVPAD